MFSSNSEAKASELLEDIEVNICIEDITIKYLQTS